MVSLNYLMDHLLYQIFFITDNPPIKIYVNIIENRITFKNKTGCYLELLTPETIKLFVSTKNKITKDKNNEYVSYLEITK